MRVVCQDQRRKTRREHFAGRLLLRRTRCSAIFPVVCEVWPHRSAQATSLLPSLTDSDSNCPTHHFTASAVKCRKFDQARLSLRRIYGLGFLRFEMKYMLQMKTLLKLSTSFPKTILAPTRASPVAPLSFLLIYGTHAKNRMHLSHYNRQLSMQKKYR
ncbi:hypothetical protein E3P84_00901 [Wallemia ichthyophaga]|nr:hypothetical protein E3P84_00901 [Wallemia ichthyophaga]TIB43968.1 hypothetical protein E3P83_00355 [Wallemia ichthyophaga]